jgi:signal peptidase I
MLKMEDKIEKKSILIYFLKTFSMLLLLLIIFFTAFLILQNLMNVSFPLLVVKSGSMRPTLEIGDIILIHGANPYEIKINDVIVFYHPNFPGNRDWIIVHRVIEKSSLGFITKGDNNLVIDSFVPVPYDCVIGVWTGFKIPYWIGLGYIILILSGEMYKPLGLIIIALIILLNIFSIIYDIIKITKNKKEQ